MASILPAGKAWRAFICKCGVRDSATFESKTRAKAWAIQREAEILAGARGEIVPRTVRQALTRFAEEVSPKRGGERWEKVRLTKLDRELPFAGRLLSLVTSDDIGKWRDSALARVDGQIVLEWLSHRPAALRMTAR